VIEFENGEELLHGCVALEFHPVFDSEPVFVGFAVRVGDARGVYDTQEIAVVGQTHGLGDVKDGDDCGATDEGGYKGREAKIFRSGAARHGISFFLDR